MDKHRMTLGSLFDGSGGFPLAGLSAGIEPLWASEIEPFPIRVTTKRLPSMRHFGDVATLNGARLPPVDIITFGSPCQDMSIAGKRAGLDGERSGLFHEALRIVKEMREATDGEKPRYIVWENVPGALSSNNGNDFKAVLEEVVRIKESGASVPTPDKGRWPYADLYLGDGWSMAYRVLDAQYWGVAQRRRRVFLVADFGGERAGDILFERESLPGNLEQGVETWQRVASDPETGAGETSGHIVCINPQGSSGIAITEGITGTLVAQDHGNHPAVLAAGFIPGASMQGSSGIGFQKEISPTLRVNGDAAVVETYAVTMNSFVQAETEMTPTLMARDYKDPIAIADPLTCRVRRLTPTECARLQGFPDWWCADLYIDDPDEEEINFWIDVFETHRRLVSKSSKPKTRKQIIRWLRHPHTNSAEYKMWGNGIALPCARFVLQRIADTNCGCVSEQAPLCSGTGCAAFPLPRNPSVGG